MVEQNAVERPIYTFVDVICREQTIRGCLRTLRTITEHTHDTGLVGIIRNSVRWTVGHFSTSRDDIGCEAESIGNIKPPGLCNYSKIASVRKMLTNGRGENSGRLFEQHVLKSATHVEQVELIPNVLAYVESCASTSDGICVHRWVIATATYVEANSNHVEVQLLCFLEKTWNSVKRCPEFDSKLADALRVVSENTDNKFRVGVDAGNLV
jgi:hypothetical protein